MNHERPETRLTIGVLIASQLRDEQQLETLLDDIERQTRPPDEVVLVVQSPVTKAGPIGSYLDRIVEARGSGLKLLARNFHEKGLSRSRNRAIALSSTDVCLFTDDDVRLHADAIESVEAWFSKVPSAAAISFRIDVPGRPRKDPAGGASLHSWRSIAGVASPEIAVRRSVVEHCGVVFDERFGLGSGHWSSGEENAFFMDLLKQTREVYSVPKVIGSHAGAGSAQLLDEPAMYGKGALFGRMYGRLGLVLLVGFTIKKVLEGRLDVRRTHLAQATRGYLDFIRHGRARSGGRVEHE